MSWDAIADADMIERLTAENARLRGEVDTLKALYSVPIIEVEKITAAREAMKQWPGMSDERGRCYPVFFLALDALERQWSLMEEVEEREHRLMVRIAELTPVVPANQVPNTYQAQLPDSRRDDGWKAATDGLMREIKIGERIASLTADLARVTVDAAKECGRLRGEVESSTRATTWANAECERMRELRDVTRADLARVTAERAGLLAAARAVFSTWICLRDAGRLVPRGLECGCESLGSAIAACAPPASGEE